MNTPRMLVTLDGSKLADAAIPVAAQLAAGLRAEVILLRVIPPAEGHPAGTWDLPPVIDLEERRAYEELHGHETSSFAGLHTTSVVMVSAHPAEEIIRWVRAHPVDLIVMATHGHGGLRHLIAGSVTEAVLRSGGVPVIAVRPLAVPEATTP
jgi:nucleotide-binding universal stress UspA family protein